MIQDVSPSFGLFFSDPAGARTQDPIIKSDVLYLLSYGISLLLYQSECKGNRKYLLSKFIILKNAYNKNIRYSRLS